MKVVSYFDKTGNIVKPWRDAGYDCWIVDNQHPLGDTMKNGIHLVNWDLSTPWLPPFDRSEIAMFFAFPPCTDVAVSGALHFRHKGLRALQRAVGYFATSQEFAEWSGAPYVIENPKTTMSTYWRAPDHKFHPCHYTDICPEDNYTKETWLWSGNGFVMPPGQMDPELPFPDDRIHKAAPGPDRADFRSATPMGFSQALFESNHT